VNGCEKAKRKKARLDYEHAKAEYDAAKKLALARMLARNAAMKTGAGAERILEKAKRRYKDIVDAYPGTQAAADAKELLDSGNPPNRPVPPAPVPPPELADNGAGAAAKEPFQK
jgi:hypothetical protein